MMKNLALLVYVAHSLAGAGGMSAILVFGWEPPIYVIAVAAFSALMFGSNARYICARGDDYGK